MKGNWKRHLALFLTSQALSLFGTSLVQYAIMWFITLETKSGMMMTISIICGFLPTFILAPFGGVWADRYSRKMLIILSDSVIAFTTLILAVLFLMGFNQLWLLFVATAVRAFGTAVQSPAVGAIIPQIVPEEKLMKANGINNTIQAFISFASPLLSGVLLTFSSIISIFFIDVVTAVVAVAILQFMKVAVHAKAKENNTTSYYSDLKAGLVYIVKHGFLVRFFLFFAVFFILLSPAAFLTPLQVVRSFGDDVWRLTAIELAFSVGMMIGGLLISVWGGFRNRIYTMGFACMILGLCIGALGLIPHFVIYLIVMGCIGVPVPMFNVPSTVLLQEKVGENWLGRVFGIFTMISSSMMPLGMLIFGPVSDHISIEWLLVSTGILMAILAVFLLGNRVLVNSGKNPAEI